MTHNFIPEAFLKEQLELSLPVKKIDDNTWEAPGMEHALAWLRFETYWPSWHGTETDVEGGRKIEFPLRCIFRGQGNKDWNIMPGSLRLPNSERATEENATSIFASIVEDLFVNVDAAAKDLWPSLTLKSGYATAQHYGMKTSLLDWTVNPAVAMDMATSTIKQSKDQMAIIYWLDFKEVEELDIEIILPPPFVYRLYLQRDFFTNLATPEKVQQLTNSVKKIIFPFTHHFKCEGIDLESNTKATIDLLPVNKWFEHLCYWSKIKGTNYKSTPGDGMKLHMQFASAFRSFAFKYPFELHAMFDGNDINLMVEDYIFQLAGIEIKDRNYCIYDPRVIGILKRFNPEYFEWAENILQKDYS